MSGLLYPPAVAVAQQDLVRLWPGTAPGSEKWTQKEVRFVDAPFGGEAIRNVVEPTLSVFLPPSSQGNKTGVIICPGGGFQALSWRQSHVPPDAPPIFIACASNDGLLPVKGDLEVYSAWKAGGHLAELYVYTKGGHGFGMKKQGLPIDNWIEQFHLWLTDQGF